MTARFQIASLQAERFAPLFDHSDAELATIGARRVVVDRKPGFPCRVSLTDADIGETVLLLSFMHHDVDSPYRASGPIYVRRGVRSATPEVDEVPHMLRHRLLSIRAYDARGILTEADIVQGGDLERVIQRLFAAESVSYLDLHNAKPGCFNCRVFRV